MKSISTQNKKGFTLIELLVVITIIGILATWAVATYSSQMQKARDSVRMQDLNTLRSWVEQFYNDEWAYPLTDNSENGFGSWWVWKYVERIPTDAKYSQPCNWKTPCDYLYSVKADDNSVENQYYNLSTWFENSWNVDARADNDKDAWVMPKRLEIWTWVGKFTAVAEIPADWKIPDDQTHKSCGLVDSTNKYMLLRWNCN